MPKSQSLRVVSQREQAFNDAITNSTRTVNSDEVIIVKAIKTETKKATGSMSILRNLGKSNPGLSFSSDIEYLGEEPKCDELDMSYSGTNLYSQEVPRNDVSGLVEEIRHLGTETLPTILPDMNFSNSSNSSGSAADRKRSRRLIDRKPLESCILVNGGMVEDLSSFYESTYHKGVYDAICNVHIRTCNMVKEKGMLILRIRSLMVADFLARRNVDLGKKNTATYDGLFTFLK